MNIKNMIWESIEKFSKTIGVNPYLLILPPGIWIFVEDIKLYKRRKVLSDLNRYYLYVRLVAAIIGIICITIGLFTGIL